MSIIRHEAPNRLVQVKKAFTDWDGRARLAGETLMATPKQFEDYQDYLEFVSGFDTPENNARKK